MAHETGKSVEEVVKQGNYILSEIKIVQLHGSLRKTIFICDLRLVWYQIQLIFVQIAYRCILKNIITIGARKNKS